MLFLYGLKTCVLYDYIPVIKYEITMLHCYYPSFLSNSALLLLYLLSVLLYHYYFLSVLNCIVIICLY